MNAQDPLYLHEEILLLALQDRKGTVVSGTWYAQAVAGALLAELILRGHIRSTEERGKLEVVNARAVGEPLLDDCLALLAESRKPKPMRTWLSTISNWSKLKHRVAEGLCRRGILRSDTDKVLLFFDRKIYPEVNPKPERELIERLREVIFTDCRDIDPRTVVTLSVAFQTGLLNAIFGRKELKARKARIEAVINGEATGKAAQEVLQGLQAAIIVSACIVPIIAS
ncbi:MAG: Golgi phosphoprotein 3 [Chlamydiales bacterium]|jgi:Golgi phosphoprotein 3